MAAYHCWDPVSRSRWIHSIAYTRSGWPAGGRFPNTLQTVAAKTQRMAKVQETFRIAKEVEIALIIFGLALVVVFPTPSIPAAIGLGLLLEASIAFVFDTFAHHCAMEYIRWLQSIAS